VTRTTGVACAVGLYGAAFASLLSNHDITHAVMLIGDTTGVGFLSRILVGFPLIYHYAAGVRHIYWDKNPQELNVQQVTLQSKILIGGSTALAIILGFVRL